ncbi:MAG TPA: PBP1A family penicillin-binding protein [Allosphingosinicella sp.]
MSADDPSSRITLYRDSRFAGLARDAWERRWVKLLAVVLLSPVLLYILLWLTFAQSLPSAESLLTYQPPLPTTLRDVDGAPVQSFARERRVELKFDEYPPQLVNAFLAAEDRTFFSHGGIDWPGLVGAVGDYVSKVGSGERARGGSTITQQVAKNLLLGDEYSVTRKIREAFLARRIESVLEKEQILELYLNQIFLGRQAYGVQAAARAYFDKDVDQLTVPQMAYLAILPKAPSGYDPDRNTQRAIDRRNWVLGEMERSEFITPAERATASAEPLGTVRTSSAVRNIGGYFVEEVRRQLIDRYGEATEKGSNGIYSGGLWVRTSLDVPKQRAAETALRDGLVRYDRGKGWRDPGLSVNVDGDWRGELARAPFGVGYPDWRAAAVLSKSAASAEIGFADGTRAELPAGAASMPKRGTGSPAFSFFRPGMIIAVKKEGEGYVLRSIPEIKGGMVVEEVASGRILAMQGGFDARGDDFNRATQALRQPGSTFKPIVYSAALDNGMTPASIIVDGPFCVYQGAALGQKCFRNFSGGHGGPQTMRWGIEQSRNLMTVRAANQTGMDKVIRLATRLGVGDYRKTPYLSIALGAGDTTVLKMTNAFSILANNGKELRPSLIDYVQDRNGKVIYRADTRPCEGCNAPDWDGKPMPRPPLRTKQLMDPLTAYQMVHILEGVVVRGTAQILKDLGRPLFGKTGTTSGPTNVWFIGGSPEIVAGIYMGFDKPRPMGGYAQGGTLAAPIFKQFAQTAYKGLPVLPFRAPAGIRMIRIDRRSGKKVFGVFPTGEEKGSAVIWEAFKPESEPKRTIRRELLQTREKAVRKVDSRRSERQRDSDFLQNQGGIY